MSMGYLPDDFKEKVGMPIGESAKLSKSIFVLVGVLLVGFSPAIAYIVALVIGSN